MTDLKYLKGTSTNEDFRGRARKYRAQNRSVYGIHEDSSTELTQLSREKTIFRGALIALCITASVFTGGCVATAVTVAAVTSIDVVHDRRTFGEYIDDNNIEFTVRTFLVRDDELRKNAHISATSMNGVLLLTGEAPNTELKNKVAGYAENVEGVRQMVDEIKISGESGYISRTNDVWLTTKVKSAMFAKTKLDANRVKVVTEAGSVYLMGLVTQEEGKRATEIARGIGGVEHVIQVFEYSN